MLRQSTQAVPQDIQLKQQILTLSVDVLSDIIHLFGVPSEIDLETSLARIEGSNLDCQL